MMKTFLIPFISPPYHKQAILVLDADYADIVEQYHTGGDSVYCLAKEDAIVRQSWQEVSVEVFNNVRAQMRPGKE